MGVDTKGKEILEKVNFEEFRQALIDSIIRRISLEGTSGCDLRTIIERTLKEKEFNTLVSRLLESIAKETNLTAEDCRKALPVLVEEDVASDIKEGFEGQVQERRDYESTKDERELYEKGEKAKLWKEIGLKRFVGEKPSLASDVLKFLKEHIIVRYVLFVGFCLLIISALLFGSVYRAVVVGLTLTAVSGESVITKIANIVGGLGGILIFFVSLTLLFQYLLTTKIRDEQIKAIARRHLEKRKAARALPD